MGAKKRRIVAAALWCGDLVFSVPMPGRHNDVIAKMAAAGVPPTIIKSCEQGFLCSSGRFLDRVKAKGVAIAALQMRAHSGGFENPRLFSEDMW